MGCPQDFMLGEGKEPARGGLASQKVIARVLTTCQTTLQAEAVTGQWWAAHTLTRACWAVRTLGRLLKLWTNFRTLKMASNHIAASLCPSP